MVISINNTQDITLSELYRKQIDNEYSQYFNSLVVEYLLPIKLFYRDIIINENIKLDYITIINNFHRLKLAFKIDIDNLFELCERYKYLSIHENHLYFSDSFSYSKLFFNYNPEYTPYIKPKKLNPLS